MTWHVGDVEGDTSVNCAKADGENGDGDAGGVGEDGDGVDCDMVGGGSVQAGFIREVAKCVADRV